MSKSKYSVDLADIVGGGSNDMFASGTPRYSSEKNPAYGVGGKRPLESFIAQPAAEEIPTRTSSPVSGLESDATDPYRSTVEAVFGKASPKPTAAVPRNINIPINIPLPWKRGGNRSRFKPGLFLSGPRMESAVRGMSDYIKESDYKPNTPGASFLHGLASGFIGSAGAQVSKRDKDLAERKKAWEEDQKNRADFLQKLRENQIVKPTTPTAGWTQVTSENVGLINQQLEALGRNTIPVTDSGEPILGTVKTEDLYNPPSQSSEGALLTLNGPEEIARFKKQYPEIANKVYVEPDGTAKVPRSAIFKESLPSLSPQALDYMIQAWGQGIAPQMFTGRNTRGLAQFTERIAKLGVSPEAFSRRRAELKAEVTTAGQLFAMKEQSYAWSDLAHRNVELAKQAIARVPETGNMVTNGIFRGIARQLGSDEVSRFNTSLAVVQPEFARLLTSPSLRGVLTEGARAEIEAVISGDYTKKQLLDVFDLLTQDAENRKAAYDEAYNNVLNGIYDPDLGRSRGGFNAMDQNRVPLYTLGSGVPNSRPYQPARLPGQVPPASPSSSLPTPAATQGGTSEGTSFLRSNKR